LGLLYEPSKDNFIGVRHESVDKEKLNIGKLFFYFFNASNAHNTVGSEFSLNWQNKEVQAKFGIAHKFDDAGTNTGKVKINNEGQIDAAIKHKIN